MLGRTDSRIRLLFLIGFLGLFAGALGVRLAYWQVGQGDELRNLATEQMAPVDETQLRRGEIVDSGGTVLATTAYRDSLAAYPDMLDDEQRPLIARRLGDILGLAGTEREALVGTFESAVPYVIVARRLTLDQSDQVREGL